jgi:hypothetical protein
MDAAITAAIAAILVARSSVLNQFICPLPICLFANAGGRLRIVDAAEDRLHFRVSNHAFCNADVNSEFEYRTQVKRGALA